MGVIAVIGITLTIVLAQNQSLYNELQLDSTMKTVELIETFKEKYSDREITEFPDSKGVPYKYVAHAKNSDVELLLEKDRVVLKAWKDGDTLCIVSNPLPRDILNNCPLKW